MNVLEFAAVLVAIAVGMGVGLVIHELTHYLFLWHFDREPQLLLPKISEGKLIPRTAFDIPRGKIPGDIRLAAIAPVFSGVAFFALAVANGIVFTKVGMAFTIGAVIWTVKLSPRDRAVARGDV